MEVVQETKGPKTIKTTIGMLQQPGGYYDTLLHISQQLLPKKVAYAVHKNLSYCQSVFNAFTHRKVELMKKHMVWEGDDKGVLKPKYEKKMVKVGDKEEERDMPVYKTLDDEVEYKKNIDRMYQEDLYNLGVHQVDDKYLDTDEGEPLAPAVLQVLAPMFYPTISPDAMPAETPKADAELPTGEPGLPPQQENPLPVGGLRIEGDDEQRDGDPVLHGADDKSGVA